MHHFCANCLGLQNKRDENFLVMSDEALRHFTEEQLASIKRYSSVINVDLTAVEKYGGGGARCMLAELF